METQGRVGSVGRGLRAQRLKADDGLQGVRRGEESPPDDRTPAGMESKAKRTLVKSPPELWELADLNAAPMEAWMAGLVGTADPVSVQVTGLEPER